RKLMSCIYRCEQGSVFGFGAQHVIDVLRGEQNAKVEQFGHRRLSTFGIGADLDSAQWRSVLRQLVMLGLVRVDHEHFNVLRLTAESREVLAGRRALSLRRASAPAARSRKRASRRLGMGAPAPSASGSADQRIGDAGLYEALRAWRLTVAREHGVPAYTVFHDSTLQEIARARPHSLEELRGIIGIGAAKLQRYGTALLALVTEARGEGGGGAALPTAPGTGH
ncbi:MAG TPA: RQC domain-containing protein, partial [Steroidobacteraceae bacterium]|nr:RQC domain-containing protein [Steroidobacteraceae bacterium]